MTTHSFIPRFLSTQGERIGDTRVVVLSHFPTFPLSHLLLACLIGLLSTSAPTSLRAAWVYESTNEFFSSADFNGDGNLDLVIVDKRTGDYRLGYQLTPGAFTWAGPRASGIDNVTGFSVARFFNTNREALAFTAPAANRVNLLDASSSASNGLPVSVFPGANVLLSQDFEPSTPARYTTTQVLSPPAPALQPGDAGSTGQYLRLIHDAAPNNFNVVSFDQNAEGLFQSIEAEFDFRMTSVDSAADGFAFMLIPTRVYGQVGPGYTNALADLVAYEEPNIAEVFAIGFDVYPRGQLTNDVSVHWNSNEVRNVTLPFAALNLASGDYHRARVSIVFTNTSTATGAVVSVTLIPNVNGLPGAPVTPVAGLFVPGLTNYDCRVEFGARTGGLDMSVDLDNLNVRFLGQLPFPGYGPLAIGPNLVLGLDIGGAANTGLDDLFVATQWNPEDPELGIDTPNAISLIRNRGGTNFMDLRTPVLLGVGPLRHGHGVLLKTGQVARAGVKTTVTNFLAYNLASGTTAGSAAATRLPLDSDYIASRFSASPLAQFLFHGPGQSNLALYTVREIIPNNFQNLSNNNFVFPDSLRQVVMLPGESDTKLLLIFGRGGTAGVYNFDGTNMPVQIRSFTAQPGETFTGAGALGGNGFMLFSGRNGSIASTFFQAWNFNGSSYTPGASGDLPSITPLSAPGNVFFFSGEPFVTNAPILLRTVNARDWSIALTGLPGGATAQAEGFSNPSNGLRNPLPVVVGPPPATTTHSLVNQYRDPISLFGHGPANGDTVADLSFSPEPGASISGVSVTIRAHAANAQPFYRLNNAGVWTSYTTPIRLFKTTTIYAYAGAQNSGEKSRIKAATYTITTPPDQLDTDGDGVPDYVEIARGTDPNRPDSDSDGYTDFDELLNGGNPLDPSTNSAPTNVIQKLVNFDLKVTPRPFNGIARLADFAASNTPVRLLDLQGAILAADGVQTNQTYARLTNASADFSRRLLTVSTEGNFNLANTQALGRELLRVFPVPGFSQSPLSNTYTGGDLVSDANNWIFAASNVLHSATNAMMQVTNSQIALELTLNDTLAAAVLEQAVSRLLLARGHASATNLSLFSFRPEDAGREAPSHSALSSLESFSNGVPTFSIQKIFLTISNRISSDADANVVSLRSIATNIYRISSASNYVVSTNIIPSGVRVTNLVYSLPLDVLRQFFDTGTIHSNYYAGRSLAPEEFSVVDLANARRALTNILASITPRPITNLTLQVRADTFTGSCTLFDATNGATTWALLDARGAPYRLIESFNLVPGSRVRALGFTDAPTNPCVPLGLEVISADLVSIPVSLDGDANANGLADSWEALFQLTDPNGNPDGDGANNLAEFLAGTDPRDPSSRPPGGAGARPAAPLVHIEKRADGSVHLSWNVPLETSDRVEFQVLASPDLRQPFIDTGLIPSRMPGKCEVIVPAAHAPARFYTVIMTIKP